MTVACLTQGLTPRRAFSLTVYFGVRDLLRTDKTHDPLPGKARVTDPPAQAWPPSVSAGMATLSAGPRGQTAGAEQGPRL